MASERQLALLQELNLQAQLLLALPDEAPLELAASILQGMWGLFARLTGEDRAERTLDELFSSFCLGK
jgi:tRNA U34 5-carboxymethylaminomethyl modifying GTPase MnmE/TrmE